MKKIFTLISLLAFSVFFSQNIKPDSAHSQNLNHEKIDSKNLDPFDIGAIAHWEHDNLENSAQYKGGWNLFRKRVLRNLKFSGYKPKGAKKESTITFVIEKNGSIAQIKAMGDDAQLNKALEKAVKNVRGQFSVAKKGITPMRSEIKIPFIL